LSPYSRFASGRVSGQPRNLSRAPCIYFRVAYNWHPWGSSEEPAHRNGALRFSQGLCTLGAAKPWANVVPQPLNFPSATYSVAIFIALHPNTIPTEQKFHLFE